VARQRAVFEIERALATATLRGFGRRSGYLCRGVTRNVALNISLSAVFALTSKVSSRIAVKVQSIGLVGTTSLDVGLRRNAGLCGRHLRPTQNSEAEQKPIFPGALHGVTKPNYPKKVPVDVGSASRRKKPASTSVVSFSTIISSPC
jgi:hypothetical protein